MTENLEDEVCYYLGQQNGEQVTLYDELRPGTAFPAFAFTLLESRDADLLSEESSQPAGVST